MKIRALYVLLTALLTISACSPQGGLVFPQENWATSTPAEQGMDASKLRGIEERIPGTTDVLIIRNGRIVYEYHDPREYMQGDDKRLVPIYSCTKGITASLIGMAIAQGHIQDVQQRISDFFPEWSERELDPRWHQLTIHHLLSMTDGLDWPETTTWRSSLQHLREAENWVEFILSRGFIRQPGQAFNYNTGASHLLSAVLERATGETADSFAQTHLFGPMGINDFVWPTDPQGIPAGGHGMWMRAQDLARIGLLMLHQGSWDGEQVIPSEWVEEMVTSRSLGYAGEYGYHWWLGQVRDGSKTIKYYFGHGFAGQFLFVVPELSLVVVLTAQSDSPFQGKTIFDNYILRAFK